MKRHIISFSESINESLGQGSVILINGKPDADGRKRLYAAHVDSFAQFHPGAVMLFLAPIFYVIKLVDGHLRAFKIDYASEKSLKNVLNLKTPGRISIVRNSNKTPLHWKTTKHFGVASALREVEHDILKENYLVEAIDQVGDPEWKYFYNEVIKECLTSVFFLTKSVEIYSMDIDPEKFNDKINESDEGSLEVYWDSSFEIMFSHRPDLDKYFEKYKFSRMLEFSLYFISDVKVDRWHDKGDYYNPPDSGWEINTVKTIINEIYIDGEAADYTQEVEELIKNITDKIKEYTPYDLEEHVKKNIKKPFYLD